MSKLKCRFETDEGKRSRKKRKKNWIEIEIEKAFNAFEQLKTSVKWNKESRGCIILCVQFIQLWPLFVIHYTPNNTNDRKIFDQNSTKEDKKTVRKVWGNTIWIIWFMKNRNGISKMEGTTKVKVAEVENKYARKIVKFSKSFTTFSI